MGVHSPYINRGPRRKIEQSNIPSELTPFALVYTFAISCIHVSVVFSFLQLIIRPSLEKDAVEDESFAAAVPVSSFVEVVFILYLCWSLKFFPFFYLFKREATRAFHVKVTVSCPVCVHNIYFKALCGVLISR